MGRKKTGPETGERWKGRPGGDRTGDRKDTRRVRLEFRVVGEEAVFPPVATEFDIPMKIKAGESRAEFLIRVLRKALARVSEVADNMEPGQLEGFDDGT